MDKSKMVRTFIETQEAPYYSQIISSLDKPFADVMVKRDLLDIGI